MPEPQVSVIVLTRSRCQLLSMALESIGRQSFTDLEIVIVNDGSTDGTASVLADFLRRGYSLRIIDHREPIGITLSRQEALLAARGEYVAILDDDDEWIDNRKLETQVAFLQHHPDVVLVGCGAIVDPADPAMQVHRKVKIRPLPDSRLRFMMLLKNNFSTSTVLFRREAALAAGGFIKDPDDFTEDYDLWLRLGLQGRLANLPMVAMKYRGRPHNSTKHRGYLRKQLRLIRRHRGDYPLARVAHLLMTIRIGLSRSAFLRL